MLAYAISDWGYENNFRNALIYEMLFLPARLIAVYVNWFILIPRLLYRNKMLTYLFSLAVMLLVITVLQRYFTLYWGYPTFFAEMVAKAPPPQPLLWYRVVQVLVVITSPVAFSTGIKLFFDWYAQRNRTKQLALEKREAELKYLHAQINPHFLFNTLNNLYGLALEKSNKVPQLILQLSDLLSYSLYDAALEHSSVHHEIKVIEDFVALERERYGDRLHLSWDIDENIDPKIEVAPLLFMPLVENAFKHGAQENLSRCNIEIKLQQTPKGILFKVYNTLQQNPVTREQTNGIGLKNLRRRLDLIYPSKYALDFEQTEQSFTAQLNLQL